VTKARQAHISEWNMVPKVPSTRIPAASGAPRNTGTAMVQVSASIIALRRSTTNARCQTAQTSRQGIDVERPMGFGVSRQASTAQCHRRKAGQPPALRQWRRG
jgi:hypothetical protein